MPPSAASSTSPLLGSHLSVAGGMHLAITEALSLKLDCLQVFTKNQQQWKAPPLAAEAVTAWRTAVAAAGSRPRYPECNIPSRALAARTLKPPAGHPASIS